MSERIPAGGPFRAAAGLHEPLSLEHLAEAKRVVSYYCPGEFCWRLLALIEESSRLVAEARILDLSRSEKYMGLDRQVRDLYSRLVSYYSGLIAGFYAGYGESVAVEVLAHVEVDGVVLRPGETVALPPGRAAELVMAGLARPLEEILIKLARASKPTPSEEERGRR